MPADHCRRPDKDEGIPPPGPGASQDHPERTVAAAQARPRAPAVEHRELLPQREVLRDEGGSRDKERAQRCEDQRDHAGACLRVAPNVNALSQIGGLARDWGVDEAASRIPSASRRMTSRCRNVAS
jgi:hypothetical protein